MGLWLVSGLWRRLAWIAAVLAFGLFAAVAFTKALAGERSCGCFGEVQVNPWYTLVLDLVAIGALLALRPNWRAPHSVANPRRRVAVTVTLGVLLCAVAGVAMGTYAPARLGEDGAILGDSQVVVLEPETWVGKRMPLLKHIDVGDRLAKGSWLVVLYSDGCPGCREALPRYEKIAKASRDQGVGPAVAFVRGPGDGPAGAGLVASDTAALVGRLSDARQWFVETPTVLKLQDGKVVRTETPDRAARTATTRTSSTSRGSTSSPPTQP